MRQLDVRGTAQCSRTSLLVRACLGTAFGIGLITVLAGPPPFVMEENFQANPRDHGWQIAGDESLFAWDSAGGRLAVTWDSQRTNSFFYLPLGTFLTKDDDFRLEFDLVLQDVITGTSPDKPGTFEIALGLLNVARASGPGFIRGTGIDTPDLVEWNYFPTFGISAELVSTSTSWAYGGDISYELAPLTPYHVELEYRAAARSMQCRVVAEGQATTFSTKPFDTAFGDFAVDAITVSSYSDAGQYPDFPGSILAHGWVDNVRLELPPPPVRRFSGGHSDGGWHAEFTGWIGWRYTLLRATSLSQPDWTPVSNPIQGNGLRQSLADPEPPSGRAFYRVRAEKG